MEEHERIELRSEEVQEILGTPPGRVVKWGTVVVLACVVVIGWLSWWVKYPDKIKVPITLTALSPPVKLVARTESHIAKLMVNNEEEVEKGKLLAVMGSTADFKDVLFLDSLVIDYKNSARSEMLRLKPIRGLQIGNLQTAYAIFLKNLNAYQYGSSQNFQNQSKGKLDRQIQTLNRNIKIQMDKMEGNQKKLDLLKVKQKRFQQLYAGGNLALQDLEKVSYDIESVREEMKNNRANIEDYKVQIESIKNDKVNINKDYQDDNNDNFIQLGESLNRLQTEISGWKMKFLLQAPVDGNISFHNLLNEDQYLQKGAELMSIIPPGTDSIMGFLYLPSLDKGKVKVGQTVIIKLASFSYHEYGSVEGRIVHIGKVSRNAGYPVSVALTNGLRTSYNRVVLFDQGMDGTAEIITEKKRFYQKVIENILGKVSDFQ